MKVSDRTRFILSAIAVGISILGTIASLTILVVAVVKRSRDGGGLGLTIGIASVILFKCSGVVKDRLEERWSSSLLSMSKRKKALMVATTWLPIMILVAIVEPLVVFLWFLGSSIVGFIIAFVIIRKMGYL